MSEVWYVAYGSNMLARRFHTYLLGGDHLGGTHTGARDQTLPTAERIVSIPHELYFAGTSRRWAGSVAFLALDRHDQAPTLGRAYLVGRSQLEDLIAQENGWSSIEPMEGLPAPGQHQAVLVTGKYNALLGLDAIERRPAVTLTTSRELPRGRPDAEYLEVVAQGLQEMTEVAGPAVTTYQQVLFARAGRSGRAGRG